MNVYDFDGTIYKGDSTLDFYLFVLREQPLLAWTILPNLYNAALFKLRVISRQEFKQRYFRLFLPRIDAEKALLKFWTTHKKRIKTWYLNQKSSNDLVISASAEFILAPICKELGVKLIATKVNPITGVFESPNVRGDEKVRVFQKKYPSRRIQKFYTDHHSDAPMMRLAEKTYMVKGSSVTLVTNLQ